MKPKGLPKTGGRKKNVPNKVTADMKDKVKLFIESNFDQIQADFSVLEPRERVTLYERMLKYIIPQKVESEISDQSGKAPIINITMPKLNKLNK